MAASALLELAIHVEDPEKATHYRTTADKILASLTQKYLTRDLKGRNDGVLTGGTYFYKIGRSVDQASIWGDFYYLEALLRWKDAEISETQPISDGEGGGNCSVLSGMVSKKN